MKRLAWAAVFAVAATATLAQTAPRKPPVPPGPPTRGFAVALLSDGIDYTRPGIAAKLARDGEGEIVGWDVVDDDRRPFLRDGPATRMVEIAPVLVAPYRLETASVASWTKALQALARSPARVAVLAVTTVDLARIDGVPVAMAALRDVLFIVPAGEADAVARPDNVLVVAALGVTPSGDGGSIDLVVAPVSATREAPLSGTLPSTSSEAAMLAAGLLACVDLKAARTPSDVKRALLAGSQKGPVGQPPIMSPCR